MATNRFKPGLELRDYYPSAARQVFSEAEARKEYARLRKIANRRLDALTRNYPQSQMARMFKGGFPSAGADAGQRIYARLFEVARYLNAKLGSVTGERSYRKKMLASLHEAGYTGITAKNFDRFTMFVEEVKQHMSEREWGDKSEQVVELFEQAEEVGADTDAVARSFEAYLNKDKELKKARKAKPQPSSYEKAARGHATGRTNRQPLGSPKQRKRGRR